MEENHKREVAEENNFILLGKVTNRSWKNKKKNELTLNKFCFWLRDWDFLKIFKNFK